MKTPRRFAVLVLAACVLALPFFLWDFRTYQLAFAAANAIAILGLNLIAGQAGLISLGHGAFYGLGAYTLAVLMRHWGVRVRGDPRGGTGRPGHRVPLRASGDAARRLLPRPHDVRPGPGVAADVEPIPGCSRPLA